MWIPLVSPPRGGLALSARQSGRGPFSGKKCAWTSISMQGIWGGGALAQPRRGPYLRPRETAVRCHLSVASRRNAMALVDGVKKILLQPNAEWAVINAELTNPATLYKTYIIPLAAIGPVCFAIGISVFGLHLPFGLGTIRYSVTTALTQAVVQYAQNIVFVFLLALIIDALAPSFGGQRNQVQALKVSAYSCTAFWVA